jgi:hypothetical protein
MALEEIKPCPFCGSDASVENEFGMDFWIRCKGEDGHTEGALSMYESPMQAITQWNRREG